LDYSSSIFIYKIGNKTIKSIKFLWLHNQVFYKNLQAKAVEPIGSTDIIRTWADIGCSTGLMTRLAQKLNYKVTGFEINATSITLAKILSYKLKNINYKKQDFYTINSKFDIVSATSLLSVVENKKEALNKLVSLLKDNDSTLIIIEPTKNLSLKNVWKLISNIKTFWFYKGLLVWAKARENKAIDNSIFDDIKDIEIYQEYYLDDMICITHIRQTALKL
jgi:2-polyprenyl-3-methyl-5-hydroxy-6-metoxy-1,4-benzoquinol methylase